jgi:5-methylcytosine-specific restriction endonuclease McrA
LKSGMPINITADAFVTWYKSQLQTCYYCSGELVNGGARSGFSSLTLDRKDNNQGYTLDNIVLCCRRCNIIKGNWLTEQQMLEIAERYFKT